MYYLFILFISITNIFISICTTVQL